MAPIVETRELFAVYPSPTGGVAALQGLTLAVEQGETCVVLGPSGSGKTTLMRILAGFERPSAGSVVVDGLDLGHASAAQVGRHRSRTLGYADQHYWRALAGELTAEELASVPLGLLGFDEKARRARARELLERVGLEDRANASPGELSGGEQQRIALCAALSHRPRLLIADEPTGELDAVTAAEVLDLLRELVDEEGTTAVVVSHDPTAARIADRVIHLRDGRVSEEHRDGEETVVVGTGGWLRVPEEALAAAGIVRRARVVSTEGAVELRPAAGGETVARTLDRAVAGRRGGVFEARGVSRRYGSQVGLAPLDAVFRPGELAVVTGPSGSGKSTLLALLAGLDLPDDGDVLLDGRAVSSLDREQRAALRRDTIAVVLQTAHLADFLTATENVELGLALAGDSDRAQSAERAEEALAAVDLAQHASRRVGVLSAGQRERVALARAFAGCPSVVLADEPTARLDAATTLAIGDLLARLARDTETTVVCATHDPLLIGLADSELRLDAPAVASAS
jgi:energy-coupling factor transport system ATP-binding protein